MSTWNDSPQRELTTNPLSGKLGADHRLPRRHRRPRRAAEQRRLRGPLHRRQLAPPRLRQPGLQGHRRRVGHPGFCSLSCSGPRSYGDPADETRRGGKAPLARGLVRLTGRFMRHGLPAGLPACRPATGCSGSAGHRRSGSSRTRNSQREMAPPGPDRRPSRRKIRTTRRDPAQAPRLIWCAATSPGRGPMSCGSATRRTSGQMRAGPRGESQLRP